MRRIRTHEEVDRLIELTRTYYARCAAYRDAVREGRLSSEEDADFLTRLQEMDECIERMKSNDELARTRSLKHSNILRMPAFGRKAAH